MIRVLAPGIMRDAGLVDVTRRISATSHTVAGRRPDVA
jgi:hypothetical protein